jgi:ATP-binding cassette, subfamily B, bacterial PglK
VKKAMFFFSKLWKLIPEEQHLRFFLVIILMFIGMLIETLSVSLVIPAIAVLTQDDLLIQYPLMAPVLQYFDNPSDKQIVLLGLVALIGVYVIKALFLGVLAWKQMRFVYGVQAGLSYRLFSTYLRQPYAFHLQRNSAQLINNTVTEVNMFTQSVLISGMTLITESLVMIGIIALLMVIEPLGAMVITCLLGVLGFLFIRLTKKYLLHWGVMRQRFDESRIKHLQQGFGGVKDMKLLGREEEFLAQYKMHNDGSAHVSWKQKTVGQFPRLWLELLAVTAISMLVMIMISEGKDLDEILPVMALFAAAAFRLLPSANRILIAIQSVRYALPVIHTLSADIQEEIKTLSSEESSTFSFEKDLILDEVCFKYTNSGERILSKINMIIPRGSFIGIIGGSGAGKSTLVDLILGLLKPSSGSIKVDGIDIQKKLRCWQDSIGYVPQEIFLTDDTLRRNIAFGLRDDQIDEQAVSRAVSAAQLEQFVRGLSDGLDTNVGERGVRLSGGQRQRIGIARALYHNPAVLVLDEATSSLDCKTENGVMDSVSFLHGKKTIVIVAHRLSTVENCDFLFRLEKGEMVDQGESLGVLEKYHLQNTIQSECDAN